jgi:hypothetical protein
MTDSTTNEPEAKQKASPQELEEVVRTMGLIFSNTFLYGAKHGVTMKAAEDCFGLLNQVLQKCGELSFAVSEAGLTVNETPIEQKNPLMRMFATRMGDLDISSFGLKNGLARDKFDKLVEIMNAKPEELKKVGGFAQAVLAAQLENVRTRVVTYKAVTEDEIIVSKKVLDETGADGGASVEEMVAFLSGEESPPGLHDEKKQEKEEKALQQISSDTGKLGDVILQAAEAGEAKGGKGQGEVTAMVVGCLKKVYDVLSKNPIVKTQKGKKNLGRTLAVLETEILARMKAKAASSEAFAGQAKSVSEAIEAMNDELEIEALAADYMKKRNAIEANEKRILRFIKSKGVEKVSDTELRKKLEEGGLTSEQWQELLGKSGIAKVDGIGGAKGSSSAEGHLAILLAHMEDLLAPKAQGGAPSTPEQTSQQIAGVVAAVDEEIRELVVKTEQKINDLVKVINAEQEGASGTGAGNETALGEPKTPMQRKKLMTLLAEVVQELCQPLAVINCSIDMIKSRHLGEVTDSQIEMLNLASSSGERVRLLIDKLLELSGLPRTLTPDTDIQSSLYKPDP